MPEEGFFRAGRTRPGPNVHGPRTGPPPGGSRRRVVAASALGHRRRHHRPRRGRPALARPAVRRPLRRPPGPAGPAVARLPAGRGPARRDDPARRCWTAGRTAAWSPATASWATCGSPPPPRRCGWSAWTCGPGPSSSPSSPTSTPSASCGWPWSQASPPVAAGCRSGSCAGRPARATSPTPPSSSPTPPTWRPAPACTARTSTRCPKRVAVEVELTRKGAARLREAWTRPRHGRWTRTVYYAPPEVAGYLTGQLQRIRPRHPIQVHPLPDVPGHDLPALPEVPRDPPRPPCAGPRLAGHPRPADPPSRPPAGRQRPAAGHPAAGLVLPAVHRGLAGRARR